MSQSTTQSQLPQVEERPKVLTPEWVVAPATPAAAPVVKAPRKLGRPIPEAEPQIVSAPEQR